MKNHFDVVFRTWNILKPFHKSFYFQLFLIFITQAITVTLTFLISKVIDFLIKGDIKFVFYTLVFYLLLRILESVIDYVTHNHYLKKLSQNVIQYLQEFSFKKMLLLNISQYTEDHSAVKKDISDRGENALQSTVEDLVLNALPIIVSIILSLLAIFFYSPIIGLWGLLSLIFLMVSIYYFQKYFRPLMVKNRDNWIEQRKIKLETYQHLNLIRQTGVEHIYIKKYLEKRLKVLEFYIYIWIKNNKFATFRTFFINISRYISLVLAIYFFTKGNLTIGAIYAIFSWSGDLYSNIGNLSRIFRNVPAQIVDIEKYFENSIDKEPLFKENGKEKYGHGEIIFNNVYFKYPKGENNILNGISFLIPENKKTAFVGHSGSGKSTIIKLLLRAYDYNNGSIKIGSKEIRDLNAVELRRNIGYVEQHVDLFDDTLKENIILGITSKKKISNKELEEVARKSRIDQFYHRLGEKKFETFVGERGVKLSGGERQRVGIARAIIKNPDILIFDEATSALDTENEARVMEAIDDVSQGKTTIIIAHRLSTIRNADNIIVMDKGKVVGQGTHSELLESCKEYTNLVEHQMN